MASVLQSYQTHFKVRVPPKTVDEAATAQRQQLQQEKRRQRQLKQRQQRTIRQREARHQLYVCPRCCHLRMESLYAKRLRMVIARRDVAGSKTDEYAPSIEELAHSLLVVIMQLSVQHRLSHAEVWSALMKDPEGAFLPLNPTSKFLEPLSPPAATITPTIATTSLKKDRRKSKRRKMAFAPLDFEDLLLPSRSHQQKREERSQETLKRLESVLGAAALSQRMHHARRPGGPSPVLTRVYPPTPMRQTSSFYPNKFPHIQPILPRSVLSPPPFSQPSHPSPVLPVVSIAPSFAQWSHHWRRCEKKLAPPGPQPSFAFPSVLDQPYFRDYIQRQKACLLSHDEEFAGTKSPLNLMDLLCPFPSCGLLARTRVQLRQHMIREHVGKPLFLCPVCSTSFHQFDVLHSHIHLVHPLTPPLDACSESARPEALFLRLKKQSAFTHCQKSPPPPSPPPHQQSSQQPSLLTHAADNDNVNEEEEEKKNSIMYQSWMTPSPPLSPMLMQKEFSGDTITEDEEISSSSHHHHMTDRTPSFDQFSLEFVQ